MICTCDYCHYTFENDQLPITCPDCGKASINRRIGEKIKATPAVRLATDNEISWYEEIQRELKADEVMDALKDQMTVDEYNWSLVMKFEHRPRTWEARESTAAYLASIRQDPERAAEIYPAIRRMYTSEVNEERNDLKNAGVAEPTSKPDDIDNLPEIFGPALRLLYSFKEDRQGPSFLLSAPNLGNIRRIDLEKIAREPSAAYTQFLLDWENNLIEG